MKLTNIKDYGETSQGILFEKNAHLLHKTYAVKNFNGVDQILIAAAAAIRW